MSLARAATTLALIATGGAAGALVRHLVVAAGTARGAARRAASIAVCNLLGAVLLAGVVAVEGPGGWWLTAVAATGFCGALTTFSTWTVDAAAVLRGGERPAPAVLAVDLAGQLVVGVGLAWLVLRLL